MTPDERIATIAQQLDTLTKLHLDGEREWREAQAANDKRFAQLTDAMTRLTNAMTDLTAIAKDHEHRIRRLERLEGEQ